MPSCASSEAGMQERTAPVSTIASVSMTRTLSAASLPSAAALASALLNSLTLVLTSPIYGVGFSFSFMPEYRFRVELMQLHRSAQLSFGRVDAWAERSSESGHEWGTRPRLSWALRYRRIQNFP